MHHGVAQHLMCKRRSANASLFQRTDADCGKAWAWSSGFPMDHRQAQCSILLHTEIDAAVQQVAGVSPYCHVLTD